MEYKNHKITEAVCAFRFSHSLNNWDITSYAEYYNAIKVLGFSKKKEIKPIQLSFQFKQNEIPEKPEMIEGDTQMVFKNENENMAILISDNYISFHTINYYPDGKSFLKNLFLLF